MTEPRNEEQDERHLESVEEERSSSSDSTTSSATPAGDESASDVESSESEGVRPGDEGSGSDDREFSESQGLHVVEDGEADPVTKERDELRETLQRVQADFENFRKRTMRDQTAQLERATERLVEELLPVLDSFELAVLNIPEGDLDETAAKLRKGVELVYAELLGVLEKARLERIEAHGKPFDPEEHEAVMRDGDGEVVTEVMRTGYRLKGRVLRPAMVKVGGSEDVES